MGYPIFLFWGRYSRQLDRSGLVPGFAWIQTGVPTHDLAKGLVCYTLQAAGLKV